MDKGKLIIDMDGCLINSIKRITDMYDEECSRYKDYKPVHWTSINTWEFSELELLSREHINRFFELDRFFDKRLEYMEYAKEVNIKLSQRFDITVCSLGYKNNLRNKEKWIETNLPFVKDFIGVDMNICQDKSHIDMSDSIFIDDSSRNLLTSNSYFPILYGDDYKWNYGFSGMRCYNWTEAEKLLLRH